MSASVPLSPADRAACAVCADWLATSTTVGLVAWFAVAAALAGLATGGAPHPVLLLVPLAFVERYLAVRVALDARLFDRLATGTLASLDDLDAGLRQTLSVPAAKAGRPLDARIAGARRLYRWQTVATVLIVVLAILAWC
ncbi:MAG: hypothetical protein ABW067_16025 [Rhizobacter sp.]